jgi:hypothetical protein
MKKSKPDAAAIEVECDACGGTGHPPVKEISRGFDAAHTLNRSRIAWFGP